MNEEERIRTTVANALRAGLSRVYVIANGCTDGTARRAREIGPDVLVLQVRQPLGIDVPKAVGVAILRATEPFGAALFLDGDMEGAVPQALRLLVSAVLKEGSDLALSNCYPSRPPSSGLAGEVTAMRLALNRKLGLAERLGAACPSHGPFACSPALLAACDLQDFAVPPLVLVRAARLGFRVSVALTIPHERLGSPDRGLRHGQLIAETIIGDCIEGLCVAEGLPRSRSIPTGYPRETLEEILPGSHSLKYRLLSGASFRGYHPCRRFDLLRVLERLLGALSDMNALNIIWEREWF